MKDTAFFDEKLLNKSFQASPPLLARLFGRKWIGIYGATMIWGIHYNDITYVLGESKSVGQFFQLPKGYKIKHILPNSY